MKQTTTIILETVLLIILVVMTAMSLVQLNGDIQTIHSLHQRLADAKKPNCEYVKNKLQCTVCKREHGGKICTAINIPVDTFQ
jgi:hypothetical protein